MTTLVVGATGATGQQLVQQLLERGQTVRAIVRSPEKLPTDLQNHPNLSLIQASILDLSSTELIAQVKDCSAIASCLGHTLSFKGIFGPPRNLVTAATRRLCQAAAQQSLSNPEGASNPIKFILMNSAGVVNPDAQESISFAQTLVLLLLRLAVPPHTDNEQAAAYLRQQKEPAIEWAAARPDGLINTGSVTEYELHPSPTRSAIFNAGTTSRINVAHFMARLITEDDTWQQWKGQMPVIYNTIDNA